MVRKLWEKIKGCEGCRRRRTKLKQAVMQNLGKMKSGEKIVLAGDGRPIFIPPGAPDIDYATIVDKMLLEARQNPTIVEQAPDA